MVAQAETRLMSWSTDSQGAVYSGMRRITSARWLVSSSGSPAALQQHHRARPTTAPAASTRQYPQQLRTWLVDLQHRERR